MNNNLNKSDNYTKDNFDDYGPVSTNKMELSELVVENSDECDFEALCELLGTKPTGSKPIQKNQFTREIATWESDIYDNTTQEIVPDIDFNSNFELDYDFEYQNNNWSLDKAQLTTDDETKLVTELADEDERICKAVMEQMDKCIKKMDK